jgi:succinate dehydrogenase (ubiquinone) cytochrome b560 subunit
MVAAVAAWPVWAKVSAKIAIGMPFFYHCVNGLRHLAWDVGLGFSNKAVMQTGWVAVAASATLTLYYAFFS